MSTAAIEDGPEPDGLIFQEPGRAYSRWRLALMLLFSLLVHAASFYVLQVAYTPTGSLLPPPAQVMLVPPGSPESASLAHWIDMADPSLMTQPRVANARQTLRSIGFHYVPSYATVLQEFKPLPPSNPADAPSQTRKPGPVPTGLLPPLNVPAATPGPRVPVARSQTRIVLSEEIAALLPGALPAVPPPGTLSAKPLERTVFLVGVPRGGGPPWLFEQASSGDATESGADADARDYLARIPFKAPGAAPVFGWATFDWGREAYH